MLSVQVVALGLMLATLFFVLWQITARSMKADTERAVEQVAMFMANLEDPARTGPELLAALVASAETRGNLAVPLDERIRFEIRDARGAVLVGSKTLPRMLPAGWSIGEFRSAQSGRSAVVSINDATMVRAGKRDAVGLMSRVSLIALVLIVPALLFTTVLLVKVGLRPVSELGRSISTRSPDNLAPIVTARRYPELGPLIDELNRLLHKVRGAQAVERRFFADAAHELLTPIAALRAQTHLLATAPDDDSRTQAQADVEGGLERIASMIRQLLTIARMSSTEVRLDVRLQDLVPLIQQRLGIAASRALDREIDIDLQAPRECACLFDPNAMSSVLDNLIDNAIRYVPPCGHIRVTLRRHAHAVWIAVADDGPGIALEYREKVLERFFRVPGSTATGSGLGLAIVAQIVSLHRGLVMLRDGLNSRGLMVCIRLPLSQSS
jgi:signal transduction histidine kinase